MDQSLLTSAPTLISTSTSHLLPHNPSKEAPERHHLKPAGQFSTFAHPPPVIRAVTIATLDCCSSYGFNRYRFPIDASLPTAGTSCFPLCRPHLALAVEHPMFRKYLIFRMHSHFSLYAGTSPSIRNQKTHSDKHSNSGPSSVGNIKGQVPYSHGKLVCPQSRLTRLSPMPLHFCACMR